MDPETHDSMTDRRQLGKETKEREPEHNEPSDYYYDDAHGYRIYESETSDDDDGDDEDNDS